MPWVCAGVSVRYEAPEASLRYFEHHLFEHPAQGGKPQMQGIRIGVEVNGQPMLLTGMGNAPIDAACTRCKALAAK